MTTTAASLMKGISEEAPVVDHHWLAAEFRSVVGAVLAPLDAPEMRDFRVTHVEAGHLARIGFSGAPILKAREGNEPATYDGTPIVQAVAWTLEHKARRFAAGIAYDDSGQWRDALDAKYPGMFGCPFETGDGWTDLLHAMAEQVHALKPGPYFRFTQVKEKYGTLRAYHHGFTDQISEIVDAFEVVSAGICETCGGPGHLRRTPGEWYRTACAEHARGADILVG